MNNHTSCNCLFTVFSCLFVIRHQVRLKLPLGPVFGQLVVGNLGQVEVGHLRRRSLHPAAGRPLWVGLPLGLQGLVFLAPLGRLVNKRIFKNTKPTSLCFSEL